MKFLSTLNEHEVEFFFQQPMQVFLFEYVLNNTVQDIANLNYSDFEEGVDLTIQYYKAAKSNIIWEPDTVNNNANLFFNKLKENIEEFNTNLDSMEESLKIELTPEIIVKALEFELKAHEFYTKNQPSAPTYLEQLDITINSIFKEKELEKSQIGNIIAPSRGDLIIK
ncbi:hypothetical protein JXI42_06615 [bacterium]|nr:hypothetical protein [bacterium]